MHHVNLRHQFLALSVVLLTAGFASDSLLSSPPMAEASTASWWSRIFSSRAPRRSGPWGGRGEGFCWLSPFPDQTAGEQVAMVWNDRPAFVWQGDLESIEIRPTDDNSPGQTLDLSQDDMNEAMHTVTLREARQPQETDVTMHRITLNEPLQPGATYSFVIKVPNLEAFLPINFQVMSAPEREQITADLQTLAAQGGTAEEIAVRRANYFADRQLWADFWQTVMTVEQPSTELKAALEEETNVLCGRND